MNDSIISSKLRTGAKNCNAFSDDEERIARFAAEVIIEQLKQGNIRSNEKSLSLVLLMIVFTICGITVLYVENLHSSLIEATGNVAGGLLHSHAFRELSMSFVKGIAEDFLNSPEMHELLKRKVNDLLRDCEPLVKDVIMRALQTEDVVNVSYEFSQTIATRLCKDPEIIEMVGQLLLDAINTETAVNGAAEWFVDLTQRKDTRDALVFLISDRILSDAKLQLDALDFCKGVTAQFLNDNDTIYEASQFIKTLLGRPALQAYLSQTLLDIVKQSVYPKWLFNPEGPKFTRLQHQTPGGDNGSTTSSLPPRFI